MEQPRCPGTFGRGKRSWSSCRLAKRKREADAAKAAKPPLTLAASGGGEPGEEVASVALNDKDVATVREALRRIGAGGSVAMRWGSTRSPTRG